MEPLMSRTKNMGLPVLVAESSSYYVSLIRDWLSDAGYGDIVFAQVKPTVSASAMLRFAALVKGTGKPGGIIECDRHANRERCQKLIDAGLPFVGNW